MRKIWKICLLLLVTIGCHAALWAQEARQLPPVTSTEGREFFVAWLPNGSADPQSMDLKLHLIVSSRKANQIRVEFPNGATSDYSVAAGQSEVILIDPQSVYWDPARDEEEKPLKKGLRVYSTNDEKFTLYSTSQIGTLGSYCLDGGHVLPVEALGTEYMVQTADADATATEFVIMSTKPGVTNVTMELKVNSRRGNTQQLNVQLNGAKQIYIVRSKAPDSEVQNDVIDLSGSTICADQPIAVWSGNQVALVPNQEGMNSDHAYDQLLPLNKWGKQFIIPMTACKVKLNVLRVVAMQDNTFLQVMRNNNVMESRTMGSGDTYSRRMVQEGDNPNPEKNSYYITADKPVQVYLYSSSGANSTWYDDNDSTRLPGDPSMTLVPPLEYLTDTTIFRTFGGGDGNLTHQINLWALSSQTANVKLDGQPITGWRTVPSNTAYSQITYTVTDTTHTITAPTKCFSGYAYGINDGQAYLYPVGYDYTPKQDSLFLLGQSGQYPVHGSEWKENSISPTESGWYLDRILQDNGSYLLDSTFVCDSTELTFPVKTYQAWYKVRWEIEGSIQGAGYYTPTEQLATDVPRPELQHQFTLLPIEQNNEPFEDFEVRGILIRKPIICDIPEDKWERDTFATVVRVLRQYNDTTWRAICEGDTVHFFRDTVWDGTNFTLRETIFNDTTNDLSRGLIQYPLGATTITRHYISSGGCDSLSTLKLFVCSPHFERRDTVVCEDGTRGLDYGEFFRKYKTGNSWPKADTTSILRDTLRATDCMNSPEWQEFAPHCRSFNGCDSVLELHLRVMTVVRNTKRVNQCLSTGPIYEWREEKSGRLIHTFSADTMTTDSMYTFRDYIPYVTCVDCPDGGCDSVRNVLFLTFVTDAGQSHTVHICQYRDTTYRNMNNSLYFTTAGKHCNTPYVEDLTVQVIGYEDGRAVVLCEFIDRVTFIIDTVFRDQMTYDTVCYDPQIQDQTYSWYGHPRFNAIPVNGPGLFTYRDTMKTYDCGCDSICVLKLRVGRPYEKTEQAEICDNESFLWQDTTFYGINYQGALPTNGKSRLITTSIDTRRDTVSRYGCDSLFFFHLELHPTYVAERKDTFVCANESYDFYGTFYNTPSNRWTPGLTYPLTINDQSVFGCDSMVLHNVTVYPYYPDQREDNDTVCQVLHGTAYYEWPGVDHQAWNQQNLQSINRAGTFRLTDYLQTVHGCDSTITRMLVVMPSYELFFRHTMSSEDTVHWEGRIYAGMDAVFDNPNALPVIRCSGVTEIVDSLLTKTVGTHACDSVRTLTLRIGQTFRDTVYDATCANCGTYSWIIRSPITGEDTTIYINDLPQPYQEKIYYDSLLTSMGFDSIYVLRLTAYPNYNYEDQGVICQGETYDWIGHMAGDNGVVHRLYVDGQPVTVIPTEQFGMIQVTDSMMTDTVFTDPRTHIQKPMHCDSVWTLTLTIHPTYNSRYVNLTDHVSLSSNDTISHFTQPNMLFVGHHFDYAAAGTSPAELEQQYDTVIYLGVEVSGLYTDSVVNLSQYGCDSVHYVQIHICEVQFTQVYDSIADNDSTWFFGGETGTTSRGEHTLPLVTGHRFHYYDDGTPVDYSVAEGRTMREYLFIDTLFTTSGCDSIVHDLVRVFPSYRFEFDTAICSNARWDWRSYTYLNHNHSGYVYDSVNYSVGTHRFDSVYVLDLEVVPSGYWHFDTTLCMNDTITWHHQKVYYQPGGLNYVEAFYQGVNHLCGDIYHLDINFVPYFGQTMVEYDTICQSDVYRWISPGETKEHTEALCDGRGNRLTGIPTDQAGDFIYYDSLRTVACGCDSVYTLHLNIKPTYHFYDTVFTLCSADTLTWHGQQYYYQGEPEVRDTLFDLSTVYACDSNYYMHVHFDLSYEITDTYYLCSDDAHFRWEDLVFDDTLAASRVWTEPRHYHYVRSFQTAISGCDSIRHLDLTIAPSHDIVWTDTLCRGEIYTLFDQQLTLPGDYVSVQPNEFGCQDHYYLTLVEMPLPQFTIQVEPVCVDEAGVANTYLLQYTYEGGDAPISYTLRYDSAAHLAGFEDAYDIPLAEGEQTLHMPVPDFASRDQYPRPGYYEAVISFENGVCLSDSLMTYPFIMEMRYPSWLTTQHWNDAIFIMDSTQNGGYSFAGYQWYRNDTILPGETRPYLYDPQYLHDGAQYSVALTRSEDGVTVRTCPIVPDLSNPYDNSPQQAYVSVVPTVVARENAIVYILSTTTGHYKLLNPQGQLVSQGAYQPDNTNTYPVQLPAVSGVYVFHLVEDTTAGTGRDLSRTVKVIVQ
ncbi:MAG: IgGFc-binding protein [Paludibacteraceae bacterium]|nr:IgGFc-binding protein [Paludibacteraceae bacterium]